VSDRILLLIPAYNEEASIGYVIDEARRTVPGIDVLVANDCSTDSTAIVARRAGAEVLTVPHHLGLGGVLQAGYRLAYELGYDHVVRIDGDGQMDPRDIPVIIEALRTSEFEMVIGSRYLEQDGGHTSSVRSLGIRFFRAVLRPILGKSVMDPTSGFVGVSRKALEVFTNSFPLEYPEIEALVVLRRRAFHFVEVPCRIRARHAGKSTITPLKSVYYIVHVLLGVLVNILKFERHRWR
jgi:glycosyltransferase involved in cell wall biosynthesis